MLTKNNAAGRQHPKAQLVAFTPCMPEGHGSSLVAAEAYHLISLRELQ